MHRSEFQRLSMRARRREGAALAPATVPRGAYGRLLTGEAVSWLEIVLEQLLPGTVAVARLLNAGAGRAAPKYGLTAGQGDFPSVCRRSRGAIDA